MSSTVYNKADLEKNSQGFAADMVCLLEEATRPRDVASFKQKMESFFTVGASRIDLIGKVMDLDNEIGGHNFDIPLLEDTEQAITNVGQTQGTGYNYYSASSAVTIHRYHGPQSKQ